ncbi:DUF739 family protein [Fusobacterium pseudoperiodonticum]|uniref:DUF739 family protein n=1 Tax=Fusobacterium pseudoperiodonticum TaxID=2663009 RepID=UPI0028EC786C|nr:DUF739 family protein [Fusobacterium pseudoperiodonticum]
MINIDKLNGKIAENRLTREKLAKAMGISTRGLSLKLKKGVFNNVEIEKLVQILKIDNPIEIFFDDFMS